MPNNKWKMSEDDRALLSEERAKADRAHIAMILASKNVPDRTRAAQAPADPAPRPGPRRS
jgi:hypothetical protein